MIKVISSNKYIDLNQKMLQIQKNQILKIINRVVIINNKEVLAIKKMHKKIGI